MNANHYYGKVVDDPTLSKDESGADLVQFTLAVDSFRKSKNGKVRERNFLPMVAYDSAALTLSKYCVKGDFALVSTTARSNGKDIVFRINEFKIINHAVPEE